MTITRSAAALAAAACLAVLTGCASHAAAPGGGATGSPSTSTTAPTPAPASTPAAPAPATTAPGRQASVPRCHTSQLSLAFTGFNEASGGQRGMTLILTNHSGTTCHVYGYPGLAFFDGLPMGTHLTWVKESRTTVVLHPGGNAQALLTWRANTATGPAPLNPDIVHVTRQMSPPTYGRPGRAARSWAARSPPGRCAPRRPGPSRLVPAPSRAPSTACA